MSEFSFHVEPGLDGVPAAVVSVINNDGVILGESRLNPDIPDTDGTLTYGLLRRCGLFRDVMFAYHDIGGDSDGIPDYAPVTYWGGWRKNVMKKIDAALAESAALATGACPAGGF